MRNGEEARALVILRHAVELNPTAGNSAWPMFTSALSSGRHDDFFADTARTNARWWPSFFEYACGAVRDLGTIERAFAARASTGKATAPGTRVRDRTSRARGSLAQRIPGLDQQLAGRAAAADRLRFQRRLRVPDLERRLRLARAQAGRRECRSAVDPGRPWSSGAADRIRPQALERDSRSQYLVLAPGKYRFEGRGRADGLDTWIGIQWGLYCLQADGNPGRRLATSDRFRGTSDWVDFHDDFVVPKDCQVQMLRFELAGAKQDLVTPENVVTRINGNVWFDDFRVRSLD
jgi:hypothetical protein